MGSLPFDRAQSPFPPQIRGTCADAPPLSRPCAQVSERERERERGAVHYLLPADALDLGHQVCLVLRVHLEYVLLSRRAEHSNNLDELVHGALAGEQRLSKQHFRNHAPRGPNVDLVRVLRGPEHQLRRAVVPGADVVNVRLSRYQLFGGPKVAQLKRMVPRVDQHIRGLDIAVAYLHVVDVPQ